PVDAPTLRLSRRLGLLDRDLEDSEAQRTSLEHLVPKARDTAFSELASYLGQEYCWEEEPNCSACPLASECPTAHELGADVVAPPTASPCLKPLRVVAPATALPTNIASPVISQVTRLAWSAELGLSWYSLAR